MNSANEKTLPLYGKTMENSKTAPVIFFQKIFDLLVICSGMNIIASYALELPSVSPAFGITLWICVAIVVSVLDFMSDIINHEYLPSLISWIWLAVEIYGIMIRNNILEEIDLSERRCLMGQCMSHWTDAPGNEQAIWLRFNQLIWMSTVHLLFVVVVFALSCCIATQKKVKQH